MPKPVATSVWVPVAASVEETIARARDFYAPAIIRPLGPIPGVAIVSGASAWSTPGDTRQLTLTDRSKVEETLTELTETSYSYRVAKFTSLFRFLVLDANAKFEAAPGLAGAVLTWTYAFRPNSWTAAYIVGRMTRGPYTRFMQAAIERLKAHIEAR
jgi:hypothetical protein